MIEPRQLDHELALLVLIPAAHIVEVVARERTLKLASVGTSRSRDALPKAIL